MKETQSRKEKRKFWQKKLDQWKASGLSQVEYCRIHQLKLPTFQYWRTKLLLKHCPPSLIQVALPQPSVMIPSQVKSGISLKIGSYEVRIEKHFDSETLTQLVKTLSSL